jgi:hypothetical protein
MSKRQKWLYLAVSIAAFVVALVGFVLALAGVQWGMALGIVGVAVTGFQSFRMLYLMSKGVSLSVREPQERG